MVKKQTQPLTYAATGVNYDALDPMKRLAQLRAQATSKNLSRFEMSEVSASRGESAFVWEEADSYKAFVVEGLGTKNLVADETRSITGKTHYDTIAQDTVAMIINDLIVVGADPQVVNAYFAVGDSSWFEDEQRSTDLVEGWARAVNMAGAVWGGGETPALKGIIEPSTIDLSGSAIGIIKPKKRLTLGDKLTAGDAILVVESNGIHANGLTLARAIAAKVPKGYATSLSDGKGYGESLLAPTHIYAGLVRELFEAGIDIHYMVNVTGHGWRKLMRANRELSYIVDQLPPAHPVFEFIQEQSGNSDTEMYGNFNMGAGFAIFMPEKDIALSQKIAQEKYGFSSLNAGHVEDGPRRVVIKPKKIEYQGESLGVR
jgi:phosphoribosylformylglycinamidine cyclo-ligase